MSTFPAISGWQLIKALRRLGFEIVRLRAATISCGIPMGVVRLSRCIVAKCWGVDCWRKCSAILKSPATSFEICFELGSGLVISQTVYIGMR